MYKQIKFVHGATKAANVLLRCPSFLLDLKNINFFWEQTEAVKGVLNTSRTSCDKDISTTGGRFKEVNYMYYQIVKFLLSYINYVAMCRPKG